LKGTNVLRRGLTPAGKEVWHLLDSSAQSHKNVVRSTFGAELFAVTGAADAAVPLLVTLEEFSRGPLNLSEARRLREEGGWQFKSLIATDSMSLFQSVTVMKLKHCSEKSIILHLLWLRDILQKKIIDKLRWVDTRDMSADGHTKGSIPRDLLLAAMIGRHTYQYSVQDSKFKR
jgi:hypothetical protein